MKIRNGFVSNSSSSSFIMMVRKDYFNEIVKGLEPLDQAVMEVLFTKDKAFGMDVMLFEDTSTDDWSLFDDIDNELIDKRALELAKEQGKELEITQDRDEWHDIVADVVSTVHYNLFKDKSKAWSYSIHL